MEFFVKWLIDNAVLIAMSFLFIIILSVTCYKLVKQRKNNSNTKNNNNNNIGEDITDVFSKAKTIFNLIYKDKKVKSVIDNCVNFVKSIFSSENTKAVMSKSKEILKVILLDDDKNKETEQQKETKTSKISVKEKEKENLFVGKE